MNANAPRQKLAPRYAIRTVDEGGIDLFDPPSLTNDRRAALEEAERRVRAHPDCTILVLDRFNGRTLWKGVPDRYHRYQVRVISQTILYALDFDLATVGDFLSAHRDKDDALAAFHEAIKQPWGDVVVVLDTAGGAAAVVTSSDEDIHQPDDAHFKQGGCRAERQLRPGPGADAGAAASGRAAPSAPPGP